ncbi:MAG: diacylglycerol kinase family protein [Pseudanabaenaceae cyanobacterium]|jgi:diacylglycerol kinase (ATP)
MKVILMSSEFRHNSSHHHPSGASVPPEIDPYLRPYSFQIADSLLTSFRFAAQGVIYAFVTQRNFRIHALIGAVAVVLCVYLRLSWVECGLVGITIALVLVLELLNTALEAVVDLTVGHEYHPLAKVAKDCAAGAVLIAALAALVNASMLFLPKLLALWKTFIA